MDEGQLSVNQSYLISVIANTNGYIFPDVLAALAGSDFIIHAGGIGQQFVLTALQGIAPVYGVRRLETAQAWEQALPKTEVIPVGELFLYVLHDIRELDLDPAAAGMVAVISGYPPETSIEWRNNVLYLNPGRLENRVVSIGRLRVTGKVLEAKVVPVEITT
jgi:predicted phosphodiesterase